MGEIYEAWNYMRTQGLFAMLLYVHDNRYGLVGLLTLTILSIKLIS
jgi:hypothetical protein